MDVFMGFISPFPWTWPPRGWSNCQGQLLAISQNSALFALLGTNFGGNGTTDFGLPDLRGRQVIGMGEGPGLTPRNIGQKIGAENGSVTLNASNLPPHTHTLAASNTVSAGLTQAPAAGWTLGAAASVSADRTPVVTPVNIYNATPLTPTNSVQSAQTSVVGNGVPVNLPTIPPALCLNFCIALQGIFPSRN